MSLPLCDWNRVINKIESPFFEPIYVYMQGKEVAACDLGLAQPTLAHMALFMLHHQGKISHIVSQNCDGLHLR